MLEDFCFDKLFQIKNLQLSGFQKLKKVKIYAYQIQIIEIAVSSLQILHLPACGIWNPY